MYLRVLKHDHDAVKDTSLNIYKASAGSGKTFTLTIEYIYLMVRPQAEEEYMHTLAVTFTNKATAEMKSRILQHLYGIWKELPSSRDYADMLIRKITADGSYMSMRELQENSGKTLSLILHDYSRFRVETIDSFFQSVLKTLARELGQSPNLQVDLGDKELLGLAVDRLIDGLDLDDKLRDMVVSYVSEELDENGKWNIQSSIKEFATCIFREEFLQRNEKERENIADSRKVALFRKTMLDIMKEARNSIIGMAEELLKDAEGTLTEELVGKTTPPPVTYLRNILSQKSTPVTKEPPGVSKNRKVAEGEKFKKFLDDGGSLLLSKHKSNADANHEFSAFSQKFSDFREMEETLVRRFYTAKLARNYTNQLQLLSRIDEIVREINEERETFPLSRTPILLSSLIETQDAPFFFEKTGTVLRNIMIDEFQDTSRLQWQNFNILFFENQANGGADLIVGDVKQSIYRWRGGDWSLLENLGKSLETWRPKIHTLDTNYRSEFRIIDFNNRLFPKAAKLLDDHAGDCGISISGEDGLYSDVIQKTSPAKEHEKRGFCSVCLRLYQERGERNRAAVHEEAMQEMLAQIEELHAQGLPQEKMAILVRNNKDAPLILNYFHEHASPGIHIASDEAYLLSGSSLVNIIVDAMRMLTEDYDKNPVPYHSFLMNYILLVEESNVDMDELMRCDTDSMMPSLMTEERNRLRQLPIYELTEELYRRLGLDRLNGQEAYYYAFLDAIGQYLRDNPNDIHSFLEMWDAKLSAQAIPTGKQEGIRILTIHKSKGLEFHTVLMPFCDWKMEKDMGETLWCEAEQEGDVFNTLGRMPVAKTPSMAMSFYSKRYKREHLQSRIDEFNALYVALTRASCNLYIWGATTGKTLGKDISTGNLLCKCLNPENEFDENGVWRMQEGEPVVSVKEKRNSDNRMQPDFIPIPVKMVSYRARLNFRQSNEATEMLDGGDGQRALGVLYHSILAEIHDSDKIETVLRRGQMQGRLTEEQRDELEVMLHQITDNGLINSWFDPQNHIFAECEILNPDSHEDNGRTKRPDRIVMRENKIMVIDYKFGDEHGSYRKQVQEYMMLLKRMYPGYEVNGYLWYVKKEKVEYV